MAFSFYGGSVSPGHTIRLYVHFNNYQYTGPKIIQAFPFDPYYGNLFLITSDIGHERRIGSSDHDNYHVYSVAVKNVGNNMTYFNLVGGDVS